MQLRTYTDVSIDAVLGTKAQRLPRLSLIVPCFNEEEGLYQSAHRLLEILRGLRASGVIHEDCRLCMIDDGSVDSTWDIIRELREAEPMCCGVRLTRNYGHQNALLAGLLSCPGDVLISLDADLQDDPAVIIEMLAEYEAGADIVLAVREDRSSDSFLKRAPARAFYRLLGALGANVISDHGDYRLMSRRVVESLREHREANLYLRGLIPQLGYRQAVVKYTRLPRLAGDSKYSLVKMLSLAVGGITSMSARPLRLIALLGLVVFLGSLSVSVWALWTKLFTEAAVPGWASTVVPMYFLGGLQLLSMAVIGEYVAKTYMETKGRPRYLVRETSGLDGIER